MVLIEITSIFTKLLIMFFIIFFSSLPLYFTVKVLNGDRATIFYVFLVNLFAGVVIPVIEHYIGIFGGIVGFFILLIIYKLVFKFGWIRAIIAWLLQFVFIAIVTWILLLLGISFLG